MLETLHVTYMSFLFLYNLKLFSSCFQGDYGGDYFLKKNFITFQKAKLSCSDGGDFPLNFNEIRKCFFIDIL